MKQTEAQIQAAFFDWLSLHEKRFPELGLFYSIPNGSWKSPAARGLFKRTGLKSGVPDVHLPVTCRHSLDFMCNGLWIEFKAGRGKVSETQQQWHNKLERQGHAVHVCRSWTEAANVTIEYLNLNIPKFKESNGNSSSKSSKGNI